MPNFFKQFFLLIVCASIFFFIPTPGKTLTAELQSMTPSAQDITDQIPDDQQGPPEGVAFFVFLGEPGIEYAAVFSVDSEPAMVVTPGADVSLTKRWSYNDEDKTITVNITGKGFAKGIQEDMPEGKIVFIVAIVPIAPEGTDGPPEAMKGGWMSMNLEEWELIPPHEGASMFGFKLTGPEGSSGFFRMFIPTSLIDLLSQFSGHAIPIQDLAVFQGNEQASMEIRAVDNGAYIDIAVAFSSDSIGVSTMKQKTITKQITVREQLPISLVAKKATVKKNKPIELYGWIKNGKSKQSVIVMRKAKGEKKYQTWKTTTTKKNGYFIVKEKSETTAVYQAVYQKKKSSEAKITVK